MFSKSNCVPTVSHQISIHPYLHYLSQHAVIIAEIVGRFLVNTVVCEVCEDIMDLGYVTGVLVRGKPDQPIFIEEDTKRVDAGYEHIQTQVKLSLIDQVWLGYVPGQYIVLDQMVEASGTNLCTSNGLVLGIWFHLLTTLIPFPLALAGGFTIHRHLFSFFHS